MRTTCLLFPPLFLVFAFCSAAFAQVPFITSISVNGNGPSCTYRVGHSPPDPVCTIGPGMTLVVSGSGFGSQVSVKTCDCSSATIVGTPTSSQVTAVVNFVASRATISVQNSGGFPSNTVSYNPFAPNIASIQVGSCIYNVSSPPAYPCSVEAGSQVTINGNYFGMWADPLNSQVYTCLCPAAAIHSWTNQQINVTASYVAPNSDIQVGISGGQLPFSNAVPYTVTSALIPLGFFGIHVNDISSAMPPSGWFGMQRLWNTHTDWYEIEQQPQLAISGVQRAAGTSTLTVSSTSHWAAKNYVYVNGLTSNCSSFNGLYAISAIPSSTTISYVQNGLGDVSTTPCSGTADYFVFHNIDRWLQKAKTQGMEVMYAFGNILPRYATQPNGLCPGQGNGLCYPPNDLNADGTGTNQHWRTFVAGMAQHLASLDPNLYAIPGYFETWNEFDQSVQWQYPQLVRLMDDLTCIMKGTGNITALNQSCSSDGNFIAKGVLPTTKVLQPSLSSASALGKWVPPDGYYATPGATTNADIIGVHSYRYGDYIQSLSCTGCGIKRSRGTVTVTTANKNGVSGSGVNGFSFDSVVLISGVAPSSFNGTFTIDSAPLSSNSFTFTQAGIDESGIGGTVQNSPDQLKQALANFVATLSSGDQAKPLWVTEGAWGVNNLSDPNPVTTDPTTQQGYAMRWYAILWAAGVSRATWYGWDLEQGTGVMWDYPGNVYQDSPCIAGTFNPPCNPATEPRAGYVDANGQAYQVAQSWMLNTSMSTGCTNGGTVWTCVFTTPAGTTELMVWDSAQDNYTPTPATYSNYPTPAGYTAYYKFSNGEETKTSGLSPGESVEIGSIPILFVPN